MVEQTHTGFFTAGLSRAAAVFMCVVTLQEREIATIIAMF